MTSEKTTTKQPSRVDPLLRAKSAWYRAGNSEQPASTSHVTEYEGRKYVVLENVNGLLAIYRVTVGGQLKRLKRWPPGVTEQTEQSAV